jgi:5-methylcytosine-specific restriction protein A
MLRPRLAELNTSSVRVLARNPGATPRLSDRSGHAAAKIRKQVLAEEPICRPCQAKTPPRVTASEEVDHIIALEDGGAEDRDNMQGICRACHLSKTAEEAKRRTCF